MSVPEKKSTTSNSGHSISSEQATPPLPEHQTFHEHLRALTRNAVRVVIEEVMREELKQFLGAAWGECTSDYRNGSYTRDLATSSGPIEDLHIPRDREGNVHTQVFDRYNRYEPQVAEGLTQMFVSGVSTHKVGDVTQTLMGSEVSGTSSSLVRWCRGCRCSCILVCFFFLHNNRGWCPTDIRVCLYPGKEESSRTHIRLM